MSILKTFQKSNQELYPINRSGQLVQTDFYIGNIIESIDCSCYRITKVFSKTFKGLYIGQRRTNGLNPTIN